MKTITYICSYSTSESGAMTDLSNQLGEIKNFCMFHQIELDEIFEESNLARDDFKPTLLNLMSNFYGIADKLIVQNPEVISRDKNFREWVQDEFKRMNIDIIYLTNDDIEPEFNAKKRISDIKEKIKNIPSLPEIITKSMEIMQDKSASALVLSRVISNDIGLTARVLKLVNSSFYGFPKQISTIQQAIVILGFTTIKGVILSASIMKMFSVKNNTSFDYKAIWQHCLLVASISRMIAYEIDDNSREDVFSAAFLHDIGKVILAQYDYENYERAIKQLAKDSTYKEMLRSEETECGLNHCDIGNIVAYAWNLPQIFCEVISNHHSPMLSENYKNSCMIVHVANVLANILLCGKIFDINIIENEILEYLNISEDNIYAIYDRAHCVADNLNDVESFFN